MGELWLTFFTPDSHAAKRRHLIDAAAAEKNRSARRRRAGQNYPERRRRKNDVGAGLYTKPYTLHYNLYPKLRPLAEIGCS